jgi:hypothetical protein
MDNAAMKKQNAIGQTLLLLASGLVLAAANAYARTEIIHGEAYNARGELEYVEKHVLIYRGGRMIGVETAYYDPEQKKIGQFLSDLSGVPHQGSYRFSDDRLRYMDGARVNADEIVIFRQDDPDREMRSKALKRETEQIVGQGINQFIVENMAALSRGEDLYAKLVLPAQMNQFDVSIRKYKQIGRRLVVRLEIDNWLLKLFTPHVEMEYDLDSRRLLRYEGISMIADVSGQCKPVSIRYEYAEPSAVASTGS